MCWGRTLEIIHRLGDIDVFPKISMVREPTTDEYKSQGTQWILYPYSKINGINLMKWNPMEGGN